MRIAERIAARISARFGKSAGRPSATGHVDHAGADGIFGWAMDSEHPGQPVVIQLVDAAGCTRAATVADRFRPDLEAGGIGSGRHGFALHWPAGVAAQDCARMSILAAGQPGCLVGEETIREFVPDSTDDSACGIGCEGNVVFGQTQQPTRLAVRVDLRTVALVDTAPFEDCATGQRLKSFFAVAIAADELRNPAAVIDVVESRSQAGTFGPNTAADAVSEDSRYAGAITGIRNSTLEGWCIGLGGQGHQPLLRIEIDGELRGYARASGRRGESQDNGQDDRQDNRPRNHFTFGLSGWDKARDGVVAVRLVDGGQWLAGSGLRIPDYALDAFGDSPAQFVPQASKPGTRDTTVRVIAPLVDGTADGKRAFAALCRQTHRNWRLTLIAREPVDLDDIASGTEDRARIDSVTGDVMAGATAVAVGRAGEPVVAYLERDCRWPDTFLDDMLSALEHSGADSVCASEARVDSVCRKASSFACDRSDPTRVQEIALSTIVHRRAANPSKAVALCEFEQYAYTLALGLNVGGAMTFAERTFVETRQHQRREARRDMHYEGALCRATQAVLIDWRAEAEKRREMTPVSIIVPFIDNADLTVHCVEAVLAHSPSDAEIVLLNNGSASRAAAIVHRFAAQYPGRIRCIDQQRNLNFALGCNLAFQASTGRHAVFLNNDTVVSEGWLQPLLGALDDETVTVAQPALVYEDGNIQCAGHAYAPGSRLPYHAFHRFPMEHPAVATARRCQSVTGACMAVRSSDFIAAEGFDPGYVNGFEDADLCLRLASIRGGQAYYEPASRVCHLESKSAGRSTHRLENRSRFIARWPDIPADDEETARRFGLAITGYRTDSTTVGDAGVAVAIPSYGEL